jgi:hypothetical protein
MLTAGIIDFDPPALLVIGSMEDFAKLSEQLMTSGGAVVSAAQHGRIAAFRMKAAGSNEDPAFALVDGEVIWRMDAGEMSETIAKLRGLCASAGPGHQYMEPRKDGTGFEVIFSKGEYGEDIFAK